MCLFKNIGRSWAWWYMPIIPAWREVLGQPELHSKTLSQKFQSYLLYKKQIYELKVKLWKMHVI
jgi:hypothetical protein